MIMSVAHLLQVGDARDFLLHFHQERVLSLRKTQNKQRVRVLG
jgi:hypothetical protein